MAPFSCSQRLLRALARSAISACSRSSASQACPRGVVLLLAQGLALDLQLDAPPLQLVELDGHRVHLHAQPAGGLVHEVDGLVGQEPVSDVAMRQHGRRDQRRVRDAHAVVHLVALPQAAQDGDGLLHAGLVHEHRLEAPLQRRVLLDVLAVLVEGRGADGVQLAPGEHRLEQVGGVHGAFGGTRPDHGVQLVDEQDDLALGVLDLLEHGLQPLLELAPVLGARDERAQVERDDLAVLEALGHVAAHDPLGQSLGDGRLADARLTDEHRIVLGASGEHLDDPPDLLVPADDRIELARAGVPGQVPAVLLERLVGGLGVRGLVTRWPPRTFWSAPRMCSRSAPAAARMRPASPPASAAANSRCSVDT